MSKALTIGRMCSDRHDNCNLILGQVLPEELPTSIIHKRTLQAEECVFALRSSYLCSVHSHRQFSDRRSLVLQQMPKKQT